MIDLINEEVKKIEDERLKTIIVCVGLGCLTFIAVVDKIYEIDHKQK